MESQPTKLYFTQKDFGQLLGDSFKYWFKGLKQYFPLYLIVHLGIAAVLYILVFFSGYDPWILFLAGLFIPGVLAGTGFIFFPPLNTATVVFIVLLFVIVAMDVILTALLGGTVIKHAHEQSMDNVPIIQNSLAYSQSRLGSIIGAQILVILITLGLMGGLLAVPFLLLFGSLTFIIWVGPYGFFVVMVVLIFGMVIMVVLLIYFIIRFAVILPSVVLGNETAVGSLGQSWNLVRGNFWRTFGLLFIIGLVGSLITSPIASLSILGMFFPLPAYFSIIYTIAYAILASVVNPLSPVTLVMLYGDLYTRELGA